jgi:hypothetical protein
MLDQGLTAADKEKRERQSRDRMHDVDALHEREFAAGGGRR